MTTTTGHRATNFNDRAAILILIQSRLWAVEPAMVVESRELTISLGDNFAFSDGLVCVSGVQPKSEGAAHIWMRETLCLERGAEGWRIVRSETSAPLRMDDGERGPVAGSKLRVGWAPAHGGMQPCREGVPA